MPRDFFTIQNRPVSLNLIQTNKVPEPFVQLLLDKLGEPFKEPGGYSFWEVTTPTGELAFRFRGYINPYIHEKPSLRVETHSAGQNLFHDFMRDVVFDWKSLTLEDEKQLLNTLEAPEAMVKDGFIWRGSTTQAHLTDKGMHELRRLQSKACETSEITSHTAGTQVKISVAREHLALSNVGGHTGITELDDESLKASLRNFARHDGWEFFVGLSGISGFPALSAFRRVGDKAWIVSTSDYDWLKNHFLPQYGPKP
jgi:hypothetical protein